MSNVTMEELRSLYGIHRELFSRLVLDLHRDPIHTMQVMASWMWIEQKRFPNMIRRLLNLSDIGLNAAADEAIWCVNCLESGVPPITTPGDIDLPVTRLLNKEISLQFFHENRTDAITGIAKNVDDICLPAFEDITKQAFAKTATFHSGGTALLQMEGIGEVVKPYLAPQGNVSSRSTGNLQLEGIGHIVPSATPGLETVPPSPLARRNKESDLH